MRVVVQRVTRATLRVVTDKVASEHARIGPGLVALAAIETDDTDANLSWMASKLCNLRIFEDDSGKMNRSLLDLADGGNRPGLLIVPNFTVAGEAQKGRRPDFFAAMKPPRAIEAFDAFVNAARRAGPGIDLKTGVFGASMLVDLTNDGPVTIILNTPGAKA